MDPFRFFYDVSSTTNDPTGNIPNSIGGVFAMVLNIVMGSAIAIGVIATVIAGIKFVTSKGDPKATDTAKNALTYAIIALVLAFGAFTVKVLVLNLIGAQGNDLLNETPSF